MGVPPALVQFVRGIITASPIPNFSPNFLCGVLFAPHNGSRAHASEMQPKR
jgi:hypothetical protein